MTIWGFYFTQISNHMLITSLARFYPRATISADFQWEDLMIPKMSKEEAESFLKGSLLVRYAEELRALAQKPANVWYAGEAFHHCPNGEEKITHAFLRDPQVRGLRGDLERDLEKKHGIAA